eukprot:CAMPEP_0185847552 /NCGR_PEP_ID=MMETSP1354-20130828/2786_1 /TAXON_ID=708628 /ORGANISM="Erythrolobus madagascarensis, Strain CCMP3276" /LENGTH=202 /DNA_ID=CAMNT_0028547859 /DNA_START=470 /DNA_END=1080 /DNA_ORIENTATION=-
MATHHITRTTPRSRLISSRHDRRRRVPYVNVAAAYADGVVNTCLSYWFSQAHRMLELRARHVVHGGHVRDELVPLEKRRGTQVAPMRPNAIVDRVNVLSQVGALRKPPVAHVAHVRLFLPMHGPNVPVKRRALLKPSPALQALHFPGARTANEPDATAADALRCLFVSRPSDRSAAAAPAPPTSRLSLRGTRSPELSRFRSA